MNRPYGMTLYALSPPRGFVKWINGGKSYKLAGAYNKKPLYKHKLIWYNVTDAMGCVYTQEQPTFVL